MKISILIPTIAERATMFDRLRVRLLNQILPYGDSVDIISWDAASVTIGAKRNALLGWAKGEYCCFIDDDDDISDNYIEWLLKAAESGCDCASLKGRYTIDGKFDGIFRHSIEYKEYRTNENAEYIRINGEIMDIKFERYPNHLNLIRTDIAKQFRFPEINHGEDTDWATQIRDSKLLTTEFNIPDVIYYYKYVSKK